MFTSSTIDCRSTATAGVGSRLHQAIACSGGCSGKYGVRLCQILAGSAPDKWESLVSGHTSFFFSTFTYRSSSSLKCQMCHHW